MIKKVPRREVKVYFLLADAGKGFFKDKIGRNELEDRYNGSLGELDNMDENDLNEEFKDKVRLRRYNEMEWHRDNVILGEMGPWPEMKGLPIEFTTGNIPEVARMIKKFKKGKISVSEKSLEKTKRCARKLDSIIRHIDFVRPNFPLILFPGGEIREKDYNNYARKNAKPLCGIFQYDMDDGSERAVAYSLSGLKDAPVFYGTRNKSSLNPNNSISD